MQVVMLFEPTLTAPSKRTIAGKMTAHHRLGYVVDLFANNKGTIKGNLYIQFQLTFSLQDS